MLNQYLLAKKQDQVVTLTLNRIDKHNALHGPLIEELLAYLHIHASDDSRVLVITANGRDFCAGADIAWMKKMAQCEQKDNEQDAMLLAQLLYQLDIFPKPTIVLAQGAILGGGLGLLAAADMVFVSESSHFRFSEVKIGLIPAIISPYIIAAIGARAANYYFLTGQSFDSHEAYRLGLVHHVVADNQLTTIGEEYVSLIKQNGPRALTAVKALIHDINQKSITVDLMHHTAKTLAAQRMTNEAQEGLAAFLEKRKPKWN